MAQNSGRSVLRKEAIGFSLILALNWLVEIVRLPHFLYGDSADFNWFRPILRSIVIIAVWAWVHFTTRRLLRRLHHLEEFLRICSWCRKVGQQGEWVTIEEYFGSNFATETTHGICPECDRNARNLLTAKIAEATGEAAAVPLPGTQLAGR